MELSSTYYTNKQKYLIMETTFNTYNKKEIEEILNDQEVVNNQFAAEQCDNDIFREIYEDSIADIAINEMKESPDYGYF